jgi:hypothetical protein
MALCVATWGGFYHVLFRRFGLGYTKGFLITTAYFLVSAGVVSVIFWDTLKRVLVDVDALPLVVLGVFMLAQLALYVYIPQRLARPATYLTEHPDRYYLDISWRRLVSKSADIVAQQIYIVLMVLFLQELGLTLYATIVWFGVLFALLHAGLVIAEWGRWPALLFGSAVLGFSLVFPVLILLVPYGFVYNIMLHWLFYTITATTFWVWHNRKI